MDNKKPIKKKYSRWDVAHTILMQIWITGVTAYISGQNAGNMQSLAELSALGWWIASEAFYLAETVFAKAKKKYSETKDDNASAKIVLCMFIIVPYAWTSIGIAEVVISDAINNKNFVAILGSIPLLVSPILAVINYKVVNKK